jgi:DNA-binding transcriptional LysR family regulator
MELRHLRFFLTLAEELHFTRAAKRLYVAQPHLSQEIRRLERELGTPLFERTKRRVELTAAGHAFREKASAIMALTEEARHAATRAADGTVGRLRIGFAGSASYDVVPRAIRRFSVQWPQVELVLTEMHTGDQVRALEEERIDVGFMRRTLPEGSPLCSRVLRRERLVLALPVGHALSKRRAIPFGALANERWIVFDRTSTGLFRDLLDAGAAAGFEPVVAQEAGEIPTMINLVASGLGIALIPESVMVLRRAGVVYRPLKSSTQRSLVVAAWRAQLRLPAVRNFVSALDGI